MRWPTGNVVGIQTGWFLFPTPQSLFELSTNRALSLENAEVISMDKMKGKKDALN
jgi:hypothetical protein